MEVSQPGDDTISSVQFSPKANFLVATSWDNNIRCWEIQQTGQSVAKAMQSHTKPILDSCWHDDGTKVFTAGADNMAKMWDLQSNQATQVQSDFIGILSENNCFLPFLGWCELNHFHIQSCMMQCNEMEIRAS